MSPEKLIVYGTLNVTGIDRPNPPPWKNQPPADPQQVASVEQLKSEAFKAIRSGNFACSQATSTPSTATSAADRSW